MQSRRSPTVDDFLGWLAHEAGARFGTLRRKRKFILDSYTPGKWGFIRPCSTNKQHRFSDAHVEAVWQRWKSLPKGQEWKTGDYGLSKRPAPPNKWATCPNKTCCPWLAALLREFLAHWGMGCGGGMHKA